MTPLKILIIEDDLFQLEKLKITLGREFSPVIAVANTAKARSIISEQEDNIPEIAVLDVDILGEGPFAGLDFAEWLRGFHHIYIFFITGHQENVEAELKKRKITDYTFFEKLPGVDNLKMLPAMIRTTFEQLQNSKAKPFMLSLLSGKIAIKQPNSDKVAETSTEYIVINANDICYAESIKETSRDISKQARFYTKVFTVNQQYELKFPIGAFKKHLYEGIGADYYQQNFVTTKAYIINLNRISSFSNHVIRFECKGEVELNDVYEVLGSKIAKIKSR